MWCKRLKLESFEHVCVRYAHIHHTGRKDTISHVSFLGSRVFEQKEETNWDTWPNCPLVTTVSHWQGCSSTSRMSFDDSTSWFGFTPVAQWLAPDKTEAGFLFKTNTPRSQWTWFISQSYGIKGRREQGGEGQFQIKIVVLGAGISSLSHLTVLYICMMVFSCKWENIIFKGHYSSFYLHKIRFN